MGKSVRISKEDKGSKGEEEMSMKSPFHNIGHFIE